MARALGLVLLVLVGVILYDVVGRKFFNTGSFVLQELEWHLHGAAAVLGFGYAYVKDAHVRIDVFSGRFPTRTRLRIELVAILAFLIPFMVLLGWFGFDFAARSWASGESSPGGVGLTNRWIVKSAIPLSALLAILGGLSVALRIVAALRDPALERHVWRTD